MKLSDDKDYRVGIHIKFAHCAQTSPPQLFLINEIQSRYVFRGAEGGVFHNYEEQRTR